MVSASNPAPLLKLWISWLNGLLVADRGRGWSVQAFYNESIAMSLSHGSSYSC